MKGFSLIQKETNLVQNDQSQKEPTQFNLKLGLFVSELGTISYGGDENSVGAKIWDDNSTIDGSEWK